MSTLSYWRGKLRDAEHPAAAAETETSGDNAFVALTPGVDRGAPSTDWDVELELGGGVVLRLRGGQC